MSGDDILVLSFGSTVAILLLVVIIRRTGEFLNAAVLFSTVWAANLVCCVVLPYQELRLQLTTLTVVVAAWWAFLVGFLGGCFPRLGECHEGTR